MRTLAEIWDSGDWVNEEPVVHPTLENMTLLSDHLSPDFEWLDKTDRQFRFPHGVREGASRQALNSNPARTQWLEANDVHTQFLDAGIGCCWFAEKGDQEPVTGDTEDEAIARLARINGLDLWAEA